MSINNTERLLTYGEAIFEGISQEMDKDNSVFVLGQDVDDPKGTLGTTKNLHKDYSKEKFCMKLNSYIKMVVNH